MDQIKIGRFIAECRKKKELTQMQLSEKLGITDKAISKWERGMAMPDTSIMLELCNILGISVNELLSGEKITMENNNQKNEKLMMDLAKELRRCESNDDVKALGVEWGIQQARELKQAGVPSIHFYSMNAAASVEAIAKAVY